MMTPLEHDFDKWRKIVDGVTVELQGKSIIITYSEAIHRWDFK